MRLTGFALLLFLLAACSTEPADDPVGDAVSPVALTTEADTIAMQAYEATGGPTVWDQVPYLTFEFAFEQEGDRRMIARHAWNRRTGDYRVSWPEEGGDTTTVLMNVRSREGTAYRNGVEVPSAEQDSLLESAYRRFINDTYWMLSPTKLFDPGVNRAAAPERATDSTRVLQLSFGDVGLTPGDRYWMEIDRETGEVAGWSYILQNQEPPASRFRWMDHETIETPAGPIRLATRKQTEDGSRAILTDRIAAPDTMEPAFFTRPEASW